MKSKINECMTEQEKIGKRIKYLREQDGARQSDIAKKLNISTSAYSKLENGDRSLSSENCIALADLFNVTCDYILRGIDSCHINVCRETCLTQGSLCVLRMNKLDHDDTIQQRNSVLAQFPDNTKPTTPELEKLSKDYWDNMRPIRKKLRFENVRSYIINSIITDDLNWDNICSAADGCLVATSGFIDEISETGESDIDQDWENLVETENYHEQINANLYKASIAFANYFKALISDAGFVSSGYHGVPYSITPEQISDAVNAGILQSKAGR